MSSAVQGMPRVISDSELTTGFTKASPVVMPDRMPMTTLNLDLHWEEDSEKENERRLEERRQPKCSHGSFVTKEREVKTCDGGFAGVSYLQLDLLINYSGHII